ncbi:MAG: ATP-binding protein [Candidatus Cloacimonetes bacterium]|nr:ATP-binding protein [Candidatus Cloacimonadota bacterium]
MVYKNYRFRLLLRISFLILTICLLFYFLFNHMFNITPVLIGIVIILQIIALIHFLESTNRYLTHFLESIRYSDFTRSFQIQGLGKAYDGLKEAFNCVIQDFQKIRAEKEASHHYLQNVIQHIGTGLIAYNASGEVVMINNAAKRLFQVYNLKNISALEKISPELVHVLRNSPSGSKTLLKVQLEDELYQLMIMTKEFRVEGLSYYLVSLQNIQTELETQELEAWQKLIRVLTHEIMNSITPISSLSATVKDLLNDINTSDQVPQEIDDETVIDIQNALKTIHKRSEGLIHFVETYRNLTRIPNPDFKIFPVKQIFENINKLMTEPLQNSVINFEMEIEPQSLELTADDQLIEQIIINLLKNSIQALENRTGGRITLKAFIGLRSRAIIQVIDNGPGILPDVIDKIFIPFFTTKKSGSGIGLSLSRQIMRLHGGTITVSSKVEEETVFSLRF